MKAGQRRSDRPAVQIKAGGAVLVGATHTYLPAQSSAANVNAAQSKGCRAETCIRMLAGVSFPELKTRFAAV